MNVIGKGFADRRLSEDEIREVLGKALDAFDLSGKRVLLIIPDGTRSGPTGKMFRLIHEYVGDEVAALDVLIALGTHQPMDEAAIRDHLGVTAEEMTGQYGNVQVFNHAWDDPATFRTLGTIPAGEIETLSQDRLSLDVPVTVNKRIFDYDHVVICGPVFPHEVVGFSGGNKYFFPGIAGREVIDVTHWLGALITTYEIIGRKHTPVRAVVDRAAAMIDLPKSCLCMVVKDGELAGLYAGSPQAAWSEAADLSAQVHVVYVDRPYRKVLSIMPEMYDDIWTASKGMFKMDPIVEDGGEIVIYAPHITEFSYTHKEVMDHIGYHVRDYYLAHWERYEHHPWGVLAHSTHLSGTGRYEDGVERPRIRVILATGIPRERCEEMNVDYCDPASIDIEAWAGREEEGILVVPHAGEILHRLKE